MDEEEGPLGMFRRHDSWDFMTKGRCSGPESTLKQHRLQLPVLKVNFGESDSTRDTKRKRQRDGVLFGSMTSGAPAEEP